MSERLPIGVVLPTLNVGDRMAAHLEQMRPWAGCVEQIVVVDSGSTDRTLQLIEEKLRHPSLQVLHHPPGLYQSWNHAIAHLSAEFTYISTVGDEISPAGLAHLLDTAVKLSSDVVVSPPKFHDADGREMVDKRWPIHELLDRLAIAEPIAITPHQAFLLAILDAPESILGSSASNLYRTAILQKHPFPTAFGHLGDVAWAIQNAYRISLAVTPRVFTRFLVHPSGNRIKDDDMTALLGRLFELARDTLQQAHTSSQTCAELDRLIAFMGIFPEEVRQWRASRQAYIAARRVGSAWVLNPFNWALRRERNRRRLALQNAKDQARRQFGLPAGPASGYLGKS